MTIEGATILGAGISTVGGLISNAINNSTARENLEMQKATNEQNIAFQREENAITRLREDNAFQRAAADLTAAGLSKTLAAGSPASAQSLTAPQAQTPNNQFRFESTLQKLNLASVMQDMVVRNEQLKQQSALNQANIAYINAQTHGQELSNSVYMENHRNSQLLKLSEISLNNARVDVERAEGQLKRVDLGYREQQITSEIDLKIAQALSYRFSARLSETNIKLTEKQMVKISYDIAESMARTEKLNEEQKLVVQDIALAKLKQQELSQNLAYARLYGLPVGQQVSGLFGSILNGGRSLVNEGNMAFTGYPVVNPSGSYGMLSGSNTYHLPK